MKKHQPDCICVLCKSGEPKPQPCARSKAFAELNHVVINAALNIQCVTEPDSNIYQESIKIMQAVRAFTSQQHKPCDWMLLRLHGGLSFWQCAACDKTAIQPAATNITFPHLDFKRQAL